MKVFWTQTTEEHFEAIYAYIAQNSQKYALLTIDRITKKSQQIGSHPLSRRKVPEYETDQIREVFLNPYRIIYHLKPDQIHILAVIHGAMDILTKDS